MSHDKYLFINVDIRIHLCPISIKDPQELAFDKNGPYTFKSDNFTPLVTMTRFKDLKYFIINLGTEVKSLL